MTRTVSFCFDDGFERTSNIVAETFALFDAPACFCILANPQGAVDPFIRKGRIAGWDHWRALAANGHEIAPHGWSHEDLSTLSFNDAVASVERTWHVFQNEIEGFEPHNSVYHAAYLRVPGGLAEWLRHRALAVRVGDSRGGSNSIAEFGRGNVVSCACFGPDIVDDRMRRRFELFLERADEWLILVFHGVEDEGWGPVTRHGLRNLVRVAHEAGVRIETPNRILLRR